MYYYELFSHSDRFSYRAHIISNSTCVLILCTVLTFLSPFLLTYYTGDFWANDLASSEQPRLGNQFKYILIVESQPETSSTNRFFTSSYSVINSNFANNMIPASGTISPSDTDGDGLIDQIRVSYDLAFTTALTIESINLWLIFPFELHNKQRLTMETMALISIVPSYQITTSSNKNLTVYGQLKFEQKLPIEYSGNNSIYNQSIINVDNTLSTLPDLDSILSEYFTRNFYTTFQQQYTSISSRTTTSSDRITINAVVNVGRQIIRYRPGFWQEFKWGWIQYISVLLPFLCVFNRLRLFVFSNHLVRTLEPLKQHRHKA